MADNGAPFPLLRAAYLRSIANVWRDHTDTLLAELVHISKTNPRGVIPKFEEDFKFTFPFPRVKLTISDKHRPRWKPVGTTGWFGFADAYQVALPRSPGPGHEAELLAEYMENYPSMLGRASDNSQAPDDFAWFGLITGRLIALAWHDEAFKHKLFDTDDARALIQDAMDVVIPRNFKLKFHAHAATRSGDGRQSDLEAAQFAFDDFPLTEICLNMPDRPSNEQESAIALAAYNHTGRQYPFTCG
jgi:ribosomally synthesized peptide (two-chain TOMM family)